jgi:hypothetical protein
MTDTELTRALERGEIPNSEFHHSSHLHVAWVYLVESDSVAEATTKMSRTLRRFATSVGHPEKYHETITVFWLRLLDQVSDVFDEEDINAILKRYPTLLEKDLLLEYYSRETLFSDRARTDWVEPDLKPLPDATAIHSSGATSDSSHRALCR